jgi:uncharacterized protein YbjT (DUF2867 family)
MASEEAEGMRVLIVGATGLIGSAIAARLPAEGHQVVAISRTPSGKGYPAIEWVSFDIAKATAPEHWTAVLEGVEALVNCAGILQDGPNGSTRAVHVAGPAALFRACEQQGVRRVVHLSAVGIDRETPTDFSRTKLWGDEALMARDLDWVILRPSVVFGSAAYGGSALMRGLAAWPILPVMPDTAPLQVVALEDLVETVLFFLRSDAPAKQVVEVVGPKTYRFEEFVQLLRSWMRWGPARLVRMPRWAADAVYRAGDFFAWFGWIPPVRTTARLEMTRGAVGDATRLTQITGVVPRAIEDVLARTPASVQERWFARLYLLKPFVIGVFALFWITTGIVSLGPGRERGIELVMDGGLGRGLATFLTLSGGLADLLIGLAMAFRKTCPPALYAAFGISIVYLTIGTVLVPWLWFDPLGPMLKIGPVMVFNLVALAMVDDR